MIGNGRATTAKAGNRPAIGPSAGQVCRLRSRRTEFYQTL